MSKGSLLQLKVQQKMNLRDHSHIKPKKFIQYDEEQQQKHIEDKSKRWWNRVGRRYFQEVTPEQLACLRKSIEQDYVITEECVPVRQQSYFERNLKARNAKMFDKKSIRVLWQDCRDDGTGSAIMNAYEFRVKCDDEEGYDQYIIVQPSPQSPQPIPLPIQPQNQPPSTFPQNINILYMKQSPQIPCPLTQQQLTELSQYIDLSHSRSTVDINFITQCNYFDLIKYQYYSCELDRELDLWQEELDKVVTLNEDSWQGILDGIGQEQRERGQSQMWKRLRNGYSVEEDVKGIQQALAWQHNLVNFKEGYKDKTEEMLAEALEGMWIKQHKTRNMGEKKRFFKACLQNLILTKSQLSNTFETDCKICFSTYVSAKNKVIYCDLCNDSFHQQCYGIEQLDQDPQSKFYCDACLYIMQNNQKDKPLPVCAICSVPFTVMKKFGERFFHPSCLFINNLLKPKLGNLQLQDGINAQSIAKMVEDQEKRLQMGQCQYCAQTADKGLRFKCAQCDRHFHGICAYLNAAVFDLRRRDQKLEVEIRCWDHFPERDHYRQIYLRRFFCNYKNTSDLSENELIEIYKHQQQAIKEYKLQKRQVQFKTQSFKGIKQKKRCEKKQLKTSKQSYPNVIAIGSDQQIQNSNYNHNNLAKPHKPVQSYNTASQLKYEIQRMSNHYSKVKKMSQTSASSFELKYLKISKYLQTIEDQEQNDRLKLDFGEEAELNTNSNDSELGSKKISTE